MRKNHNYSNETVQALKMVSEGKTPFSAAKNAGITPSAVYAAVKNIKDLGYESIDDFLINRVNIEKRKPDKFRFSEATKRAVKLVEAGKTPESSAQQNGVSPASIYNALRRLKAAGYSSIDDVPLEKFDKPLKSYPKIIKFYAGFRNIKLFEDVAYQSGISLEEFVLNACLEKAKEFGHPAKSKKEKDKIQQKNKRTKNSPQSSFNPFSLIFNLLNKNNSHDK